MTQEEIKTWVKDNLESFKKRMRIFGNAEDENLEKMLTSSATVILRLIGVNDFTDKPEVEELVFERARYIYNDALDEFMTNYEEEIYTHFTYYKLARIDEEESDDIISETAAK